MRFHEFQNIEFVSISASPITCYPFICDIQRVWQNIKPGKIVNTGEISLKL